MEDTIFAKMARGEISVNKIYENDNFFSVLDINQDIKGHALIISKKPFLTTLDLPSTIGTELLDCIKKTSVYVMKKFKATGFNILSNNFESAGQVINHVHYHIFPRREGDGIKVID